MQYKKCKYLIDAAANIYKKVKNGRSVLFGSRTIGLSAQTKAPKFTTTIFMTHARHFWHLDPISDYGNSIENNRYVSFVECTMEVNLC